MARTPFAPITPEVLRWAREDAGVTVADLAARVGVDAGRVRAWEIGEEQPSLAKLRQAAELLGRPVAFFFVAEPPNQGVQRPTDFRRTDCQALGLMESGLVGFQACHDRVGRGV